MMAITVHPVTFAVNDYISQELNPLGGEVVAIIIPDDWTPASLSFYAGPDGSLAKQAHDTAGVLMTVQVVANSVIQFPPGSLRGHYYLSLVSGSEQAPVEQSAMRLLQVVVRT